MKYKKYILGLATMGLVSACTDLTPEIYSNLTTANAYSTEADIDAAVVGLYSDMNPYPGDSWLYYGGYMVMITDYATDMGYSTAAGVSCNRAKIISLPYLFCSDHTYLKSSSKSY
mgnify:CR=1 FL=1